MIAASINCVVLIKGSKRAANPIELTLYSVNEPMSSLDVVISIIPIDWNRTRESLTGFIRTT